MSENHEIVPEIGHNSGAYNPPGCSTPSQISTALHSEILEKKSIKPEL